MAIQVDAFLAMALAEIRAARAGDVIQASDQDFALSILNELLEAWSGTPRALFAVTFSTFTLTANTSPHFIGPPPAELSTPIMGPVLVRRPVSILSGNLWISSTIKIPMTPRDRNWWSSIMAPTIAVTVTGDYYYEPTWPYGSLFLWPIEASALQIELQLQTELLNVAATDSLNLPQGYQRALRLTLAEMLAPGFGQVLSPSTQMAAMEARAQVFGNNDRIPLISTRDGGMPGRTADNGRGRSNWNVWSGQVE